MKALVFQSWKWWILSLLLTSGCTRYHTEPPHRLSGSPLLAWARVGSTTSREVLSEWGPPSRSLQQDRILFYRLTGKGDRLRFVKLENGFKGCNHSLVLVFNSEGVLERSSIVRIR